MTVLAGVEIPPVIWSTPVLIGIFGLPGTGKTEIARLLGNRIPLVVLSTDAIRLRYGLASGSETIDVMYTVSAVLLANGASVLLDGIHLQFSDRLRLRRFAERHGADSALIYATARHPVIKLRLRDRERFPERTSSQGKFVISDSHFARIAAYLEPPQEHENIWTIDTSNNDPASHIADLERWLQRRLT